jgi:hypothetical protein
LAAKSPLLTRSGLQHSGSYRPSTKTFEGAIAWRPYIYRYLAVSYAQLDRLAEARALIVETVRLQPSFTLGVWATIEPYESRADLAHMLDGLRKAGVPD